MSLVDRIGKIVRAELSARLRPGANRDNGPAEQPGPAAPPGGSAPRAPMVTDVDAALRALEMSGTPSLDEVRARYRDLARRYHPKTRSLDADEASSAHLLQETLTEALELLEEHLLPMPPAPPSSPPTVVG